MSKATNKRSIIDVIKRQKRDAKRTAGIARANASGLSGAYTAITSGPKSQASASNGTVGDLNMHTYDIKDIDRLYFSTTAGSTDTLLSTDTGIESLSSYDGTTYTSYGMKFQIPNTNIFQFNIGSKTDCLNIGTTFSYFSTSLGIIGSVDIYANYIQVDETTPTLVGTVPADERRLFSDSTNNSELSVKKSDGTVVSLEGGSSTWVGTATSQLIMQTNSITGEWDISGGQTNFTNVSPTLGVQADLDMNTYDIKDVCRLGFELGGTALQSTISGITADTTKMHLNVPSGDQFVFTVSGTPVVTIANNLVSVFSDFEVQATDKILLDGGINTYIHEQSADDLEIVVGGDVGLKLERLSAEVNTVFGALSALATNANTGFVYLPTMAGTPTGNSFNYAGKLPIVVDSTNSKLYLNTTGSTWVDIGGANTSLSNLTSTGETHFAKTTSNNYFTGQVNQFYHASGTFNVFMPNINLGGLRVTIIGELKISGALNHDGSTVGFYGTTPILKPTSVAVTASGIHAALVSLGLIT